jgi:hypothetical protein
MRKILFTASLAVAAALAVVSAAVAAPSPSYQVAAIRLGVPAAGGSSFAGTATGSTGDRGFWQARLAHDPLAACSVCAVNGGTFTMTTNDGSRVTGTFVGGSLAMTSQAAGCGQQQFTVDGALSTSIGPLTLSGVLTQYRFAFRGTCVAVAAVLQGTLGYSTGDF